MCRARRNIVGRTQGRNLASAAPPTLGRSHACHIEYRIERRDSNVAIYCLTRPSRQSSRFGFSPRIEVASNSRGGRLHRQIRFDVPHVGKRQLSHLG
jgi:hypothetical protein